MIVVDEISKIPPLPLPCGLTIGSFDGVHIGHQAILQRLKQHGTSAVLTFRNHPSHVLTQKTPTPPLYTLEQKLSLLEEAGVDLVILLSFTPALAEQSFDQFLNTLRATYPFTYLVLGKGASFGKNRQGDEAHVRALGQQLGFTVEYLEKTTFQGSAVSSGRIRTALEHGDLTLASHLLGRPYQKEE
jgi:riboflavin kinase/FMN adenylyltransferase